MPDLPVILEAQPGQILSLGRTGESDKICYTFNLDPWFASREFANGDSLQLIYMIGGPVAKLVETFTYDTSLGRFDPAAPYNYDQYPIYKSDRDPQWQLYWPITSDLTNAPGSGTLQVKFSSKNGEVYETILYQTMVSRSVITLGTLTEQEKLTYSQWLAALQRAIAETAGLGVSSTTIGPFEDPYIQKGTAQETQTPILNFYLPASRPTFRKIYSRMGEGTNNLFSDVNSEDVEVGDCFLINKETNNPDYRGLFYQRIASHSVTYSTTLNLSTRIETLPASPTEEKLYIVTAENGISYQEATFGQWDIISYTQTLDWHVVYKCIVDMSIIGPKGDTGDQGVQGISLTNLTIPEPATPNQYRLQYTLYNPSTGTSTTDTISAQALYNFFDNAIDSTSTNASNAASSASDARGYKETAESSAGAASNSAQAAQTSATQVANTSATASVTSTVGIPSVVVTKTIVGEGSNSHINLDFAFNNLKGDTGAAINVIGQVSSAQDIPSGTYHNGDGYLVGATTPYDLYVYYNSTWNNNGPLGVTLIEVDTTNHALKIS